MRQDAIEAIRRAATEHGINPAWALAVAQRESDFDPNARASKTIYGVFQMTNGLRNKWGSGDSADPYTQAQSFMRYIRGEVRPEMRSVLGRDPTNAELYAGHHFGPVRAARMIGGGYDQNTPVDEIFTPYERSLNPHFDRAGTSGNLLASINNDMAKRTMRFGGDGSLGGGTDFAESSPKGLDFSQFGTPVDAGGAVDFSQFGTPVETTSAESPQPSQQAA